MLACSHNCLATVQLLLEKYPYVIKEINSKGYNGFVHACQNKSSTTLEFLINIYQINKYDYEYVRKGF